MTVNESQVEDAALSWLAEIDYAIGHGPHFAPGEPETERDSFADVVLVARLRNAIRRINPTIPDDAIPSDCRRADPNSTASAEEPRTNRTGEPRGVSVTVLPRVRRRTVHRGGAVAAGGRCGTVTRIGAAVARAV